MKKRNDKIYVDDKFKCEKLGKLIIVQECLEKYLNANIANKANDPCCGCKRGLEIREIIGGGILEKYFLRVEREKDFVISWFKWKRRR